LVGEIYDRLRDVYARLARYMIGRAEFMLDWRGI